MKKKNKPMTALQRIVEDYKSRKYSDATIFFQLCNWLMNTGSKSYCKEKISDYFPCKRYDESEAHTGCSVQDQD